jgi:sec-independent protein translocase protein TatC
VVVAFVIAAVVTPPDVISQLALAIPMCILYEVGLIASKYYIRFSKKPDEPQPEAAANENASSDNNSSSKA